MASRFWLLLCPGYGIKEREKKRKKILERKEGLENMQIAAGILPTFLDRFNGFKPWRRKTTGKTIKGQLFRKTINAASVTP